MPAPSEIARVEEERKIYSEKIIECVKNNIHRACTYTEILKYLEQTLQYNPEDEFTLCRVLRPALIKLVRSGKLLIATDEERKEFSLLCPGI